VKKTAIVLFSTICLVASCKKSDPTAGAAGSAAPLAAAVAPGSLGGFEGDITLSAKSVKEGRPAQEITMTVKGAKMRFDMPSGMAGAPVGRGYGIVSVPDKKLYMVVDQQKMVMVMDLDRLGEQMKKMTPHASTTTASNETPPKVVKTGQKDTVAGMSCEEWDITNAKGERGRVCVAGESASWLTIPSLGLSNDQLWAKEIFDGQHFPLRMVGYDTAGKEENRLEVTKLARRTVSDAELEVPAGYRTMDFGQMMAGMEGMLAGMAGGTPGTPGQIPAMPSGFPQGMTLPPGMKLPKNAAEAMKELEERAKAAGIRPPAQPKP